MWARLERGCPLAAAYTAVTISVTVHAVADTLGTIIQLQGFVDGSTCNSIEIKEIIHRVYNRQQGGQADPTVFIESSMAFLIMQASSLQGCCPLLGQQLLAPQGLESACSDTCTDILHTVANLNILHGMALPGIWIGSLESSVCKCRSACPATTF